VSSNGAIPWDDARDYAVRIARKRGLRHEDAEDVAQDTLLKIWPHRAKVTNWRAYLFVAVCNQVHQWRRHDRLLYARGRYLTEEEERQQVWDGQYVLAHHVPTPDGHPLEGDPADIIAEAVAVEETLRRFRKLLAPAMLHIVLLLAEGLSTPQAAARLGCTEVNIRVNKHRAKRKLLQVYQEATG
jgi:RNA polymerase sigma factor (sigma-70 family)